MDKEKLLAPRADTPSGMPEDDVEIPGVGTVRVRGLSRAEVLLLRKATDNAESIDGPRALVLERKTIAMAMVDPALTEGEVRRWQEISDAGELEPVTAAIRELSGMGERADKAAYKSVPGRSGIGVRVLPGGEAGADGGGAPAGDVQR